MTGRIRRSLGIGLEAEGVAGEIGDLCLVHTQRRNIPVEIVGFHDERTVLLPLDRLEGLGPNLPVECTGRPWTVPVGEELLGRVVDGLGRPIDDAGPLRCRRHRDLTPEAPAALTRTPIQQPLVTGVRAIDQCHTIGQGQRVGIFSGSGVGKSTLLGMILRESKADVTVLALIGERGREVGQFLTEHLDDQSRRRTIVVAATSDRPAMQRLKGAHVAATIAEHFRDQGANVLLVMDSATRFAMAIREAGLAAGEPPTNRGYPPSLYAEMPRLVERFGTSEHGSVTALLTVLVEGDDLSDPAADCLRGLLDGHLVLSRSLAERGHYPPIDPLQSLSRLMPHLVTPEHWKAAQQIRSWLARYEENRDLIEVGAYRKGSDPSLDRILELLPRIRSLLCQGMSDPASFEEGQALLHELTVGVHS